MSDNGSGVWMGLAAFAAAKGGDGSDAAAMQRRLEIENMELPRSAGEAFGHMEWAWEAIKP